MQNENIIIPHFHGINFELAKIKKNEQNNFFLLFKNGGKPYYNEAILKNAYIDYIEKLSEYKQKLLEDFYLRDIENILNTSLNRQEFNSFQESYVNRYKSCYSPQTKKFDSAKLNNQYKYVEDKIQKHNIIEDFNMYSPSAKERIKSIYSNPRTTEINKLENRLMQSNAFDPFVAMSKLPRHAAIFAFNNDEWFEKNFSKLKEKNFPYIFCGIVLCSFHTKNEYLNSLHYDTLAARRYGFEKLNRHYINQTEVDFLSIEANKLKFAFPILIISKDTKEEEIEKDFGIKKTECNLIKQAVLDNRTNNKYRENIKGIIENLTECYSNIILKKAKELAQKENKQLVFIKPDNTINKFDDSKDIMGIQKELIDNSENNPQEQIVIFQNEQPKPMLTQNELNIENEKVNNKIESSISQQTELEKARNTIVKNLVDEEKYETICNDRIISYEEQKLTREKKDKKLCAKLQEIEKNRYVNFIKNKEKDCQNQDKCR